MTCDPKALLAAAACFQCLSARQLAAIRTYLECQNAAAVAGDIAWTPASAGGTWSAGFGPQAFSSLADFRANVNRGVPDNLTFSNKGLTSLTGLRALTNLQEVVLVTNPDLNVVDLSGLPLLGHVAVKGCGLTWVFLENSPLIEIADFSLNALPQSAVDYILVSFTQMTLPTDTLDLSGGTNAHPSAVGLAAKTAIELRNPAAMVTIN